jgi:hypothetical protein
MSFPSIGLSQDFSVTWNAQMSAHVLLDKRGGLKRVLACRDSGGADDWVLGTEKRATWTRLIWYLHFYTVSSGGFNSICLYKSTPQNIQWTLPPQLG